MPQAPRNGPAAGDQEMFYSVAVFSHTFGTFCVEKIRRYRRFLSKRQVWPEYLPQTSGTLRARARPSSLGRDSAFGQKPAATRARSEAGPPGRHLPTKSPGQRSGRCQTSSPIVQPAPRPRFHDAGRARFAVPDLSCDPLPRSRPTMSVPIISSVRSLTQKVRGKISHKRSEDFV
jgi:hypothetical protein